jgi:hypothetical protein
MKMDKEKMIIHINLPNSSKGSLIDNIKQLKNDVETEKKEYKKEFMITAFNPKEKKKDKKRDKKKKKQLETHLVDDKLDVIDEVDNIDDDDFIDLDALINEDDEDDDGEFIISEQKGNYSTLKKDENQYKKEFAEELTLLYKLLDEMKKFGKQLESKYNSIDGSKIRGTTKNINELAMAILSSKTNQLSVMREITNIKKTVAELKLKAEKDSKAAQLQNNSAELISTSFLQKIMKNGRNHFVDALNSNGVEDDDDDGIEINDIIGERSGGNRYTQSYVGLDNDAIMQDIENRLNNTPNNLRSEEGNKYIQYENKGVKICVKKCIDTGEWDFIAVDKDNQAVYDYPLPRKKEIGKMKFTDDEAYAIDGFGRRYRVMKFFSELDE